MNPCITHSPDICYSYTFNLLYPWLHNFTWKEKKLWRWMILMNDWKKNVRMWKNVDDLNIYSHITYALYQWRNNWRELENFKWKLSGMVNQYKFWTCFWQLLVIRNAIEMQHQMLEIFNFETGAKKGQPFTYYLSSFNSTCVRMNSWNSGSYVSISIIHLDACGSEWRAVTVN